MTSVEDQGLVGAHRRVWGAEWLVAEAARTDELEARGNLAC